MPATKPPRRRSPVSPPIASRIAHRNLPLLLLQAREAVLARFRPMLNAAGVTEQQWRVLRALVEAGALEPREIVEVCRISSPSLAGVLARMEAQGLVQRERLEHDLRRQQITPSSAGRALVRRLAPTVQATYAALEDSVGSERLQALHAVLDEVLSKLGPSPALDPEAE
jgi:homoprotocatechuate degradation regulator HpaR